MKREQVIEWAREADLDWHKHWDDEENKLERFAQFVADAKESQILDLLERLDEQAWGQHNYYQYAINAIRESSNASND